MQQQLPFSPEQTRYINSILGLFEKDSFVYYLHNGSPLFCHVREDRNSYHFKVGNLICNKLCSIREFLEVVSEARKNIERYAKTFREKGAEYFFSRKETRGQCYKITEELKKEIQSRLDDGDLLRIKSVEQNKLYNPGEMGKLVGYDL